MPEAGNETEGRVPVAPAFSVAPPYPLRHSGPVLVCGFGPTFHDDFARARALRPGAPVIGVNGAAAAVKLDHLFSLHYERKKLGRWVEQQKKAFGAGFIVHAPGLPERLAESQVAYPYVDFFWNGIQGVGTSTWSAAKLARFMGFEEIILVGMPLERGPYGDGAFCRDFRRRDVLKLYRDYIRGDTGFHAGVKAMSGWTARFFGEPA